MSTKALKTQLMAAIAMTLVAAVALGSSTFAWFAAQNNVTATTNSISAVSDAIFLQINSVETENETLKYGTSATSAAIARTQLRPTKPTFTNEGALNNWQYAYSDTTSAYKGDDQTLQYEVVANGDEDKYYLLENFWVKVATNSNAGRNLKIKSVTATGVDTDKFANAFSILVVGADGYSTWNYRNASTYDGRVILNSITATAQNVKVYLYFNGDDADVYTDKTGNVTGINVTITFEAELATTT